MTKDRIYVYVGTYQQPAPSFKKGIFTYTLDPSTGHLAYHSEINDIDNTSFLAIDSRRRKM